MSGHKFNKIKIEQSMFSKYNAMKLEPNHRGNLRKFTNIWKVSNILKTINAKEEVTGKLENTMRQMREKNQYTKTFGMQEKPCSKGIYSSTCLH
jgi:hypothetical protein